MVRRGSSGEVHLRRVLRCLSVSVPSSQYSPAPESWTNLDLFRWSYSQYSIARSQVCAESRSNTKMSVGESPPSSTTEVGSIDVGAILARARRVSIDIAALTKQSISLLSDMGQMENASIREEDSVADLVPSHCGELGCSVEVELADVLSRFKTVQSVLSSIQESDTTHEHGNLPGVFVPTAIGLQAVFDLRDTCSGALLSFVHAAAKVSIDLVPQASCIQEAMLQQLSLFELLYAQGVALSDERVIDTLGKISAAIQASSVDPLAVAPSIAPHVSMLSGVASGLNWLASFSTPKELITDTLNAIPVYGKRVMERGVNDAELVNALQGLLRRLLQHVSKFHPNCVVWDCSVEAVNQANGLAAMKQADAGFRHDDNKIFQSDLNFAELFGSFYSENVEPWLAIGVNMEEMVQRQMKLCELAFKEQQKLLGSAMVHRQPKTDEEWAQALGHLNMLLVAIEDMGNQKGVTCIDKMRM